MYFLSFSVIFSAAQRAPSNYAIEFYFTIWIQVIMEDFSRESLTSLTGQTVLLGQYF